MSTGASNAMELLRKCQMILFTPTDGVEEDGLQDTISRRAAVCHMAALSLIASTLSCSKANAQKGGPQALQGEVKAAVMQAFRKAADKGKVMAVHLAILLPCDRRQ